MLQGEHSAILLTFIKLPFVIEIFVLSIFEWRFYTGFTVSTLYSAVSYITYKGSYMSAYVLLNLLNELGKRDIMRGLLSISSLFRNE